MTTLKEATTKELIAELGTRLDLTDEVLSLVMDYMKEKKRVT